MITLAIAEVAQFFEDIGNGRWRCKSTGYIVFDKILQFYQDFGKTDLCGLSYCGLPVSNEVYPLIGDISRSVAVAVQKFERAFVAYDPDHKLDLPPGANFTYLLHLDYSPKRDIAYSDLNHCYHGITSSWKHIKITGATAETLNRPEGDMLNSDWWEAKMPHPDISYFDPWNEYWHDRWLPLFDKEVNDRLRYYD